MSWWRKSSSAHKTSDSPSVIETPAGGKNEASAPRPPLSRGRKLRRAAIAVPALAVLAIAPWFVPWGGNDSAASSDPSSMIKQATHDAGTDSSTAPTAPSDQDVKNITKTIGQYGVSGYDVPVSASELTNVSTKPGPYRALGQITIPAIGLNVKWGEGVFAETLEHGPGHWPGTPWPGRTGNAVISGHRNTHTQPFKYLNLLKPGDKIITKYGDGAPVTYKVTKTTIVPQAQYKDFVLRQPDDDKTREITLFACHPEGNPIYRIVVQGVADSSGS